MLDKLFGKKKDPNELAKEWKKNIRQSGRELDRSLRDLAQEEQKIKLSVKQAAKKGDMESARILAKGLVEAKKSKKRIHNAKAQLGSIELQITQQQSQLKVMGALQKSGEVMKMMNDLMKLPELMQTMKQMGMEMEKAGLIEEMASDMIDDVVGGEEDEEEVDEEIDGVLQDVLGGALDGVRTQKGGLERKPVRQQPVEEEEEDDEEFASRLKALKA
jgi:charged multivesicular body protein 3